MARFNEILVGRFNRSLQKLTAIKGEAPAPQLSSEIYPVHLMEHKVEYRVLESWNRYAATMFQAAGGAGNFSSFRLRNPAGSNLVVVVEKAGAATGTTGAVFGFSFNNPNLTTTQTALRLDSRTISASSAIPSTGLTVGISAQALQLLTVSNGAQDTELIITHNQEVTLLPGDGLDITASAANAALNVWYWWRERFLEDSERTA